MERYFATTESTVQQLKDVLNNLIEQGFGKDTILIYEPDTEEYEKITGLTYCHADKAVRFYTDEN